MTSVICLHGFRSGPSSIKNIFLKQKLVENGFQVFVPDMNYPDFENMTVTSMIEKLVQVLQDCNDDTVVIANSLGTLPLLNAINLNKAGTDKIKKIILLSPTFDAKKNRSLPQPQELFFTQWQEKGYEEFDHYAYGKKLKLKYEFIADLDQYPTDQIILDRPTMVIHSKQDEVVDIQDVKDYLRNQNNVIFYEIENSDHSLNDQLDFIWENIRKFI